MVLGTVDYVVITIFMIFVIVLLFHIAISLKNIRLSNIYKNSALDEIQEYLAKLCIAKRIEIRQKYGIDLEEFYNKYKNDLKEARLKEFLERNENEGDY